MVPALTSAQYTFVESAATSHALAPVASTKGDALPLTGTLRTSFAIVSP